MALLTCVRLTGSAEGPPERRSQPMIAGSSPTSKVPQSDAKVGNTNQLVAQRFATQVYAELKPAR